MQTLIKVFPVIMRPLFVTLIILLASPHAAFTQDCGDFENPQYIKNYDGSTINFNVPGINRYIGRSICCIKVAGIHTPKIKGKCDKEKKLAQKAQSVVHDLMKNASRIVLKDVIHRFGRISATVLADGIDISNVLVGQGLAVRLDGERKAWDWCK